MINFHNFQLNPKKNNNFNLKKNDEIHSFRNETKT